MKHAFVLALLALLALPAAAIARPATAVERRAMLFGANPGAEIACIQDAAIARRHPSWGTITIARRCMLRRSRDRSRDATFVMRLISGGFWKVAADISTGVPCWTRAVPRALLGRFVACHGPRRPRHARTRCRPPDGASWFRVVRRRGISCWLAEFTLSDMVYVRPHLMLRRGFKSIRVPRHGANYRRGEDYGCRLLVRRETARGWCRYRPRPHMRFWFVKRPSDHTSR